MGWWEGMETGNLGGPCNRLAALHSSSRLQSGLRMVRTPVLVSVEPILLFLLSHKVATQRPPPLRIGGGGDQARGCTSPATCKPAASCSPSASRRPSSGLARLNARCWRSGGATCRGAPCRRPKAALLVGTATPRQFKRRMPQCLGRQQVPRREEDRICRMPFRHCRRHWMARLPGTWLPPTPLCRPLPRQDSRRGVARARRRASSASPLPTPSCWLPG